MSLSNISTFLAMGPAPTPPGTTADPKGTIFGQVGFILIMFVALYFVMIRPQQKKQKQQAELLKAVKSGDEIVTNSGIKAKVITVKEKSLIVRSADAKLEIIKSAVAEITERSGESSEA
jgi:preprotein translocase subunit YajC